MGLGEDVPEAPRDMQLRGWRLWTAVAVRALGSISRRLRSRGRGCAGVRSRGGAEAFWRLREEGPALVSRSLWAGTGVRN